MYNFFRPRRAAIYIPNWQTPNRLQLLYFYSTETNLPQTRLVHESDSTKSKSKQIHRLRHLDRFFLLQHGFLLPKPASLLPNRLLLLIDAGLDTCPKTVSTHVPQFRSNIWFCSETLSGHDCIFETSPRTISKTLIIPPWTAYETTFYPSGGKAINTHLYRSAVFSTGSLTWLFSLFVNRSAIASSILSSSWPPCRFQPCCSSLPPVNTNGFNLRDPQGINLFPFLHLSSAIVPISEIIVFTFHRL